MSTIARFADQARSRGVSLGPRGNDFVRACFALAASAYNTDAAAFAAARWGASSRAAAVTKAAVSAATTNNPLTGPLVSEGGTTEFFASVAERSIIGRLAGMRRTPFYIKTIAATGATVAHWVGEAQSKPLSPMVFSSDSLAPRKVMSLTVATREMLESSDPAAEAVLRAELMAAVTKALDEAFIDPANAGVAGITPASITNGLSAVTGTADVRADFKALLAAFDGDLGSAYIVTSPELAAGMAGADRANVGARGGTLYGVPLLTSRHVPAGVVVLIDPTGIAVAEGEAEIRTIREGDVLMADDPAMASAELGSPTTPIAAQLTSLWQTNSTGVLVGRHVNWARVRPGSVALVSGASYGDAA